MTTPRSDTDAINRPKHGAADETQSIPRPITGGAPGPAAPGPAASAGPAARPYQAAAPVVAADDARASRSGSDAPAANLTKPDVPRRAAGPAPARTAAQAQPPARPAVPTRTAAPSRVQAPAGGAGPSGGAPSGSASSPAIPTRPPAPARRAPARGPRRARLQLRHIDPWSALKFSLVVSIALFFVWMVAVGVLYGVLNGLDVFSQVNGLWADLQGTAEESIVTPSLVFGGAAVIGAINILLFTALSTVGAFIYNLCADLVGGLEITLGERD